jgi:hypothetical protein
MVKHPVILAIVLALAVIGLVTGKNVIAVVIAAGVAYLILRMGVVMLGGLARPVPAPLPSGELRKVRLLYRCSVCGTEVRMTAAPDEDPEPPRHCLEDMDLVAPTME